MASETFRLTLSETKLSPLILKPFKPDIDVLMCDEIFVVAEASLESVRDVEELVDEYSILSFTTERIELLGDYLDDVSSLDVHCELPYSTETMDSGDDASRLAPSTPNAVYIPWFDVVEPEYLYDLVNPILNIGCGIILDQV